MVLTARNGAHAMPWGDHVINKAEDNSFAAIGGVPADEELGCQGWRTGQKTGGCPIGSDGSRRQRDPLVSPKRGERNPGRTGDALPTGNLGGEAGPDAGLLHPGLISPPLPPMRQNGQTPVSPLSPWALSAPGGSNGSGRTAPPLPDYPPGSASGTSRRSPRDVGPPG